MGLGREAGLCHNRFLTMGMCAGRHSRWHFRRGFLVPGTKMVSRNRNLAKQERLSKHGGRAGKSDLRHGQGWSNAISDEWSVLIESLYGAHGGLTPVGVTPDLFLKPCQGSASHAGLRPRPRMASCWSFFLFPPRLDSCQRTPYGVPHAVFSGDVLLDLHAVTWFLNVANVCRGGLGDPFQHGRFPATAVLAGWDLSSGPQPVRSKPKVQEKVSLLSKRGLGHPTGARWRSFALASRKRSLLAEQRGLDFVQPDIDGHTSCSGKGPRQPNDYIERAWNAALDVLSPHQSQKESFHRYSTQEVSPSFNQLPLSLSFSHPSSDFFHSHYTLHHQHAGPLCCSPRRLGQCCCYQCSHGRLE